MELRSVGNAPGLRAYFTDACLPFEMYPMVAREGHPRDVNARKICGTWRSVTVMLNLGTG